MSSRAELVPLGNRLAALQGARLLHAAVVVVLAGWFGAEDPLVPLVPLTLGYALSTSVVEVVRRWRHRRALVLVRLLLLADGVLLAIAVAGTGGPGSRLLFLMHLHVVACTLLASFRSGMVVAAWQGIVLATVDRLSLTGSDAAVPARELLLAAASFLLAAGATAAFASLNERALRRGRLAATALVELGSRLERARDVEDVSAAGALHLRVTNRARRAAVLVCDGPAWRGVVDDGESTPVSTRASHHVGDLGGQPRLVADVEPGWSGVLAAVLPGSRNVVVAPLLVDGELVGLAAAELGPARATYSSYDLELVVQVAARLALGVHSARLLERVEHLATSDPLTGLSNRRLFDTTLEREVARSRRSGAPLALAMLDVDHFKAVNDRYGHQVGDEVLRQLAAALQTATRRDGLVARYGGEEFVVLVPDASGAEAVVAAERLRASAALVRAVPVTVSVGVANLDGADDATALVAAADAALYEAKARGRNCVVSHAVGVTSARLGPLEN